MDTEQRINELEVSLVLAEQQLNLMMLTRNEHLKKENERKSVKANCDCGGMYSARNMAKH